MKSPSISNHSPGFSLIEVLMVFGIMAILASLSFFFSMDFYRAHLVRAERDLVISILQKARTQAINNVHQAPHGLKVEADEYVIFEGPDFASSTFKQSFDASQAVKHSGINEVVFSQLTGTASGAGDIIVAGGQNSYTILINNEGRINWKN